MNLDLGHTRDILAVCGERGLLRKQAAYVLATAYWETAQTMNPVKEAYWLSEAWRRKNLRYFPWYGRGFVQLTWEENYRRAGQKLGLDLTTDPDAVMEAGVSAQILVVGMMEGWFTAHKLPYHVNASKTDYRNARRVVNGTDKAADIAALAVQYEALLAADGYGPREVYPAALPEQPARPPLERAGLWALILSLFTRRKT